jgi:Bacteriocin-protection, YdeI or OmpD-Associated/Domain of unknown function (DUF1905)
MKPPLVDNTFLLKKFPGKGGWTYASIPEVLQDKTAPFGWVKVCGSIENYEFKQFKLMPMGDGSLFFPVRAEIRKKIKKEAGDEVRIILYSDLSALEIPNELLVEIPEELLVCLKDEPRAHERFLGLSEGKQKEIIDWISQAKKEETKVERIASSIEKLLK